MRFNEAVGKYFNGTDNYRVAAKDSLIDFIQKNPYTNIYQMRQWAEEECISEDLGVEEILVDIIKDYSMFRRGGKWISEGESTVDEDELMLGRVIEEEHTSNHEDARRIALDHLAEIPDYYTRLVNMKLEAGVELDRRIQKNIKQKIDGKDELKQID